MISSCRGGHTLRTALPTALAAGTVLCAVNRGAILIAGEASTGTWVRTHGNQLPAAIPRCQHRLPRRPPPPSSPRPPAQTLRYAHTAPRGEIKRYDAGHFDFYVGEAFEALIRDQVEFLTRQLNSALPQDQSSDVR